MDEWANWRSALLEQIRAQGGAVLLPRLTPRELEELDRMVEEGLLERSQTPGRREYHLKSEPGTINLRA
jgi:hypothetical protein